MYIIIIHSSSLEDFLSDNKLLYKGKKQGILDHFMLLWAYTKKNDKRPIK